MTADGVTAALAVAGLAAAYGEAVALAGVDLAVRSGEIVALIGETGSGKTTLVRAILGVLPLHGGRVVAGGVRVAGVDTGGGDAHRVRGRTLTLVPQDPAASLNPLFRVGTQIDDLLRHALPGAARRERTAATLATLAEVHLPDGRAILRRYPHQLSGGQRQRVVLAMALLPQPAVLVADEPTAALDAVVAAEVLALMRRAAAGRGVAILVTTHALGAAWEIADTVAVMYAGRIVERAPAAAFFAAPRHPYARHLLASVPQPGRPPAPAGALPPPAPSGCGYRPRCPAASGLCRDVRPALAAIAAEHQVACHHPSTAAAPPL